MAKGDAQRIGKALIRWLLADVVGFDPIPREGQGVKRCFVALRQSGVDFGFRDAQAISGNRHPVKALRIVDQRRIPALDHITDDGSNGLIDIFGNFTLCGEQLGDACIKIRIS